MANGIGSDIGVPNVPVLKLLVSFLRLGLTAFGGPVMVAYIRDLAVRKHRWVSEGSMRDGVALCQSLPGATAIQTAAYVGLRAGGTLGALAAYVGFGLPAFILMLILSFGYAEARDLRAVVSAFTGLQAIVVALVANATFTFGRSSMTDWRDALLALGAAVFLRSGGSPIVGICGAGLLGALLFRGKDGQQPVPSPASGSKAFSQMGPALMFAGILLAGLLLLWVLDRRLFDLAALMVRVDLFAFGGGFASVPLMLHEVVEARGWMDSTTFMDGIALGQVTPGPIVITATFVGYRVAGFLGALVGTIAVFSPSFILLLATVPHFDRLKASRLFQRAVRGALGSFVGLLLATTIRFGLAAPWTIPSVIIAVFAFVALRFKVDILWVVLAGALISTLVL
jgi:chromate transporter